MDDPVRLANRLDRPYRRALEVVLGPGDSPCREIESVVDVVPRPDIVDRRLVGVATRAIAHGQMLGVDGLQVHQSGCEHMTRGISALVTKGVTAALARWARAGRRMRAR
jgi:hypothetical protein